MNKKFILIVLLCLIAIGIGVAIKLYIRLAKLERFVMYNDIVINTPDDPFIRKIIPNTCGKYGKPIKVYYQCKTIDDPPTSDTFNILVDMEPHYNNSTGFEFDQIITCKSENTGPKFIYTPVWSFMMSGLSNYSIPDLLKRNKYDKTKFCAYMYSNCQPHRENFFVKLNRRKRVDALGVCQHNVDIPEGRHDANWVDKAIENYKPYKFVITFENTLGLDGYVTEKIIYALIAGCIPIYAGSSSIKEQLNPNCYISLDDFSSEETCIDYIMEVDRDVQLSQMYTNMPIISKDKLYKYAGWYYGSEAFYNTLFEKIPYLKRTPYIHIPNYYQSNPHKNIKVINLDASRDRWTRIEKIFKDKPFLKYERFPAVNGKKYYSEYKKYIDTKWLGRMPRNGELGIYLSTFQILYNLINDDENEYYLILEDDIILEKKITSIDTYVKEAPKDWDMLFLGSNKQYCDIESTPGVKYVRMTMSCMPGNFGVLFRKRAAQYFINFAFPILSPIDEFYRMHSKNLNMYLSVSRPISVEYGMPTTIH